MERAYELVVDIYINSERCSDNRARYGARILRPMIKVVSGKS
jgi:hypothetical protein